VAVSSPDQARATAQAKDAARTATLSTDGRTGQTTTGDFTDFLKIVAKSPTLITAYSKMLKAGNYYKGKITGKYTPALIKAFNRAEEDRALVSLTSPISRDDFFQQISLMGEGTGTGTGGPSTVTSVTKYKPEAAQQIVNSIILDTLGRKATAAEIKKYTEMLKGIEGKASTVTNYSGSGSNQKQTVTTGLSEEQYLIDKISGTDEGKANKVLGFYETFMNALGGR
jgi:hypothetical protein